MPRQLTTLWIYSDGSVFSGHEINQAPCKDLTTAAFHGSRFDDEGLAGLADFKKLETVILSNTKVTDAGMVHLAGIRELKTLQLSGTEVTAKGLAALASLKSLRHLSFGKTPAAAALEAPEVARSFPEITAFTPAPGKNTGPDLEVIGRSFPKITMAEEVPAVAKRRCVLVLDNASWHKVKTLRWHHIEPLYLPPYSPDFNPVERLWQHLKSHFLASRRRS